MTHDRQNGTAAQRAEPAREGNEATRLATNHGPANWAWAHDRSGYDWMDSHYFPTDFEADDWASVI